MSEATLERGCGGQGPHWGFGWAGGIHRNSADSAEGIEAPPLRCRGREPTPGADSDRYLPCEAIEEVEPYLPDHANDSELEAAGRACRDRPSTFVLRVPPPMPMMIGFAEQRRALLEAELVRFVEELPPFGVQRLYVTGAFGRHEVRSDTPLEVVIVHPTAEPFHRRADFFVDHLRPRLQTQFLVYTPEEFEELADEDPVLIRAISLAEPVYAR